jgi:hypothetical protein
VLELLPHRSNEDGTHGTSGGGRPAVWIQDPRNYSHRSGGIAKPALARLRRAY